MNGAIVLVAGVGLLSSVLPVFGNSLYAPGSSHNFGSVKAGQTVKHTFTVRKLHPWPVTVKAIYGDCGCTRVSATRRLPFQLTPLQAVEVTAEVDTKGRSGHISQSIVVTTSDNPRGAELSIGCEAR